MYLALPLSSRVLLLTIAHTFLCTSLARRQKNVAMTFAWRTPVALAVRLLPSIITLPLTLPFLYPPRFSHSRLAVVHGPRWNANGSSLVVMKSGHARVWHRWRVMVLESVVPHTCYYWVLTCGLSWRKGGGLLNPFWPIGTNAKRFCRFLLVFCFSLTSLFWLLWLLSRTDFLINDVHCLQWGSWSGSPTGRPLGVLFCGGVATP